MQSSERSLSEDAAAIKQRSAHLYVQALAFVSRHQDSLRLRNKGKGETFGFLYSLFDTFTFLNFAA